MCVILGPHPRHMEVPRLGVELELPAHTIATAMQDPSSQQCQIPNPLSEARDLTCILMDASRVHFCWATRGTLHMHFIFILFYFCFLGPHVAYGGSQARGLIRATAADLHQSHSNTRSLAHWARQGIEPATSWFLVDFVSAEPGWELFHMHFRVSSSKELEKSQLGFW